MFAITLCGTFSFLTRVGITTVEMLAFFSKISSYTITFVRCCRDIDTDGTIGTSVLDARIQMFAFISVVPIYACALRSFRVVDTGGAIFARSGEAVIGQFTVPPVMHQATLTSVTISCCSDPTGSEVETWVAETWIILCTVYSGPA